MQLFTCPLCTIVLEIEIFKPPCICTHCYKLLNNPESFNEAMDRLLTDDGYLITIKMRRKNIANKSRLEHFKVQQG